MATRSERKSKWQEKNPGDSLEKAKSFLSLFLRGCVQLEQNGSKVELGDDQKWEIWRTCRHLANQPKTTLAKQLASPILGVLPVIGDLLLKTEVGSRNKSLNPGQKRDIANLSDQLDFALALIYRNLGYLVSWRGLQTRNSDLFAEAVNKAKGDGVHAARLIRRCRESFPDEIHTESENVVYMFAWDTYQRVEELDRLADEFPQQIVSAAKQMHGWPMLRFRHHDNSVRFKSLAERFDLGAEYPLDASRAARFRADTPMVRYLDPLMYRVHLIHLFTRSTQYDSAEAENDALRRHWWDFADDPPGKELVAVLRIIRTLPPLTKATAAEWSRKGVVPLILATSARNYKECEEPALRQIARQRGVKSAATFKSRLLAAVIPTLTSMARLA